MKTEPGSVLPQDYIASIEHVTRRTDGEFLLRFFSDITGWKPQMWGPSIIGYGRYAYKYDSGREGESPVTGFSPRKANQVIYIMPGYRELSAQLERLGKHRIGKSCLYINKLADINLEVLEEIIREGVDYMQARYVVSPE